MSKSNATEGTRLIMAELQKMYPDATEFKRSVIDQTAKKLCLTGKHFVPSLLAKENVVKRGVYDLSAFVVELPTANNAPVQQDKSLALSSIASTETHHVAADPTFVPWGNYKDVATIIKSNMFYPTYITGLSGNGKTVMTEQACAKLGREYIRINITEETDDDDLLGGFRLIDGETVFAKGPVIKAMETGAVLLLDELDRATNKIMCLQSIMEGKPVILKKTGETIAPAPGFTVFATGNTKGSGAEDARFTGARILDDAFLERFTIVIEQPFPTAAIEKKIVLNHMEKHDCVDKDFAENLCKWADVIRKTYADEGVDEIVSTRRLCHIVQTFSIFNDKMKAITMCTNRFDEDTSSAFVDLYTKVDEGIITDENNGVQEEDSVI